MQCHQRTLNVSGMFHITSTMSDVDDDAMEAQAGGGPQSSLVFNAVALTLDRLMEVLLETVIHTSSDR